MNVTYNFSGRTVVITGAATGIGRETAIRFAEAGASVAVCDNNEVKGMETVNDITSTGLKAIFCKVDVRDTGEIKAMKKKVLDEFGTVDILINNAGVGPGKSKDGKDFAGPPLTNISYDDWQRVFDINVFGSVKVTTEFYDTFAAKREGKIIFNASIAAYTPGPLQPHYNASKAAIISFAQSLSKEMGYFNVNVNVICPGFVYTPIYEEGGRQIKNINPKAFGDCKTSEDVMNRLARSMSSLKRAQTAEDMANAAMFLASDAAKEITGQSLCIDSGIVFK